MSLSIPTPLSLAGSRRLHPHPYLHLQQAPHSSTIFRPRERLPCGAQFWDAISIGTHETGLNSSNSEYSPKLVCFGHTFPQFSVSLLQVPSHNTTSPPLKFISLFRHFLATCNGFVISSSKQSSISARSQIIFQLQFFVARVPAGTLKLLATHYLYQASTILQSARLNLPLPTVTTQVRF